MGVERLQLLVQFCNLSGLLPFRMILDEETRRFKRFEGHWRHLANWWCSFITAIKVAVLVASIYFAAVSFLAGEKQSLAYQLVYLLYCSNYAILLLLSPSLFLFRIRHLESAFESLHRIDRMIEAAVKSSCTIRRRTFIGILIIVIDLLTANIISVSVYIQIGNELGIVGMSLFIFFINLFLLQLLNWFLLFYLSYYSVSYRIRILNLLILTAHKKKIETVKIIRLCGFIFNQIAQAINELNLTFSFSVFLVLTVLIVICATSLFFGLFFISPDLKDTRNNVLLMSFLAILFILIILTVAESPIAKLKQLREILIEISSDDHLGTQELLESTALLRNLVNERIQLTACGLFTVGKHLIPAWTSVVITYLAIFVQTAIPKTAN